MATTIPKSMKKKNDGRPGLNRQSSVQQAIIENSLQKTELVSVRTGWYDRSIELGLRFEAEEYGVQNLDRNHLSGGLNRFPKYTIRYSFLINENTEMPTTQFDGVELHCRNVDDNDQVPKYQNSYRLEPYKAFNVEIVDKIVKQVMINNLEDAVYDAKESPKLCLEISEDIRSRIKKQNFDRYKIIVVVTINEKSSQAIQASMRFIWDIQRDNYSDFTFETRTFFAYCCVFGVYCE